MVTPDLIVYALDYGRRRRCQCNVERNGDRRSNCEMRSQSVVYTLVCNVFVTQTRLLATYNDLKERHTPFLRSPLIASTPPLVTKKVTGAISTVRTSS
jgi:hypothetical protein